MGFLTRCKRPFLFAFLLQFCNMLFSFFLKTFLILFEKQQPDQKEISKNFGERVPKRKLNVRCKVRGMKNGPSTGSLDN